jgi:hypothetical protein
MNIPLFHKIQHEKMFKDSIISVYCATRKASDEFKAYLSSLGYKWRRNGSLESHDQFPHTKYYCHFPKGEELSLCMDREFNDEIFEFYVEYKVKGE